MQRDRDTEDSNERLNYFNYFTEVEEEFVRRRGKQMLISPMDWALVESWKDAGIPLLIVLRAINEAFDAYDARAQKQRKVNSLFYCQQAVEASFAQYRMSQVGGENPSEAQASEATTSTAGKGSKSDSAFSREAILDFLRRSERELEQARVASREAGRTIVADVIERAQGRLTDILLDVERSGSINTQNIERDLDAIDRMILEAARDHCSEDELRRIESEAKSQLRSYRKKMDKEIYEQTFQNFVHRQLRDQNRIPRLSLFYIDPS